jgi:hypothetical protein
MALFDEQIFDDRIFDTKPPVSDHTYYHIQGLEGDGTPDNAFRPVGLAGVDWAASYDPDDSTSAFVCVKARPTTLATLPLQSGVTVLADITTLPCWRAGRIRWCPDDPHAGIERAGPV